MSRRSRRKAEVQRQKAAGTRRSVLWRWRRGLFLVGLLLVLGIAGVAYLFSQVPLPDKDPPLLQTTFICADDVTSGCNADNALAQLSGGVDRVSVSYDQVPQVLVDAGCMVGPSGCSACLGGPADTFGRLNGTETCISTTNRNFPGRMGSKNAAVYLASPLTVAASALTGHVTDPREFVSARIETGMAGVL